MMVLSLDTSTRAGSVALMADGDLLGWATGDGTVTHGERLPQDVLSLLQTHHRELDAVDLFAVCTGPGSFTGLRVGLATMQGLALAHRRPLCGVPTLEALAHAGLDRAGRDTPALVVPWMDAQRSEVFAAVYAVKSGVVELRHPPTVGSAEFLVQGLTPTFDAGPVLFVGDAVAAARRLIETTMTREPQFIADMPPLAPTTAQLASARGVEDAVAPHAIRPVYVRRPDAELARERRGTRQ